MRGLCERKVGNLIQLIYHSKEYEGDSKDYEFSRQSMEDRWRAATTTPCARCAIPRCWSVPPTPDGVFIFDVAQHGRE